MRHFSKNERQKDKFSLRLVSLPIENLVVGEDADHRKQGGGHDAKYLSKRYNTSHHTQK